MGPGPSKMEAVQADEGSEKAERGSQYSGTGCVPSGVGAAKPEHKLDDSCCPQKIRIVAKLPPSPDDNSDVNHREMPSRRSDDQRAVCVCGLRPERLPGSGPERQALTKSGDDSDCNKRRIRERSNEDAA